MDFIKIANGLKGLKCSKHGESPKISSKGKDPVFEFCCDDFGKIFMTAFNKKVEVAMADEVKNMFNKR